MSRRGQSSRGYNPGVQQRAGPGSRRRHENPDAHRAGATGTPHPALTGLVEEYHGYRIEGATPGVHHGLPSRALTLVIAFDEPLDVGWLGRDQTRGRFWTVASGLSDEPAGIVHDGRQFGIQLDLTPMGARALLGVPAAAIAADLVSVEELVGPTAAARLYDVVADPSVWDDRFAALDRELLRWLGRGDPGPRPVSPELTEAWRWLGRHVGSGTVSALADEVGWSRRHLTARFRAEYGISPKDVARISRFQRARELLGARQPPSLADVAARCGYADQAHLNREWRALAGCTPTWWQREEVTFVQYAPAPD
jgi:AraC-like DNA-binding protein